MLFFCVNGIAMTSQDFGRLRSARPSAAASARMAGLGLPRRIISTAAHCLTRAATVSEVRPGYDFAEREFNIHSLPVVLDRGRPHL